MWKNIIELVRYSGYWYIDQDTQTGIFTTMIQTRGFKWRVINNIILYLVIWSLLYDFDSDEPGDYYYHRCIIMDGQAKHITLSITT